MRLAVIGTGYVGLVTGACFSQMGHDVACVDVDESKIASLKSGKVPIYEPGLEEMVSANLCQGRLSFTTDLAAAAEQSLFLFIAVGTPPLEDGTADLRHVLDVARAIGQSITGYRIVVTKSTVPVGTAAKVLEVIREELAARRVSIEVDVVSNPEFLREGSAIDDFMNPDRVVIGCDDPRTLVLVKELYSSFARDGRPILTMGTSSAEMTKYAANCMLASKISFINEIACLCERVGANIEDVRMGIGADHRIGYQFIHPGIGYGGSCFPKDVKALVATASASGRPAILLEAVEQVNQQQKRVLFDRITEYYKAGLNGRRFALWGLSFKPETDDVREAPALVLIEALCDAGATVAAYDPKAIGETQRCLGPRTGLSYADSNYDALEGADALILVTEWALFRNPDFGRIKELLKEPVIFDGRNVYAPGILSAFGFDYFSVGRAPVLAYSGNKHRS